MCAPMTTAALSGITKAFSAAAAKAVRATAGEFLRYNGAICDARFSKSCGGITERYASAWEDEDIPIWSLSTTVRRNPAPTVSG